MPYNPKQAITVFTDARDGYGDALKHPERSSYNFSYNWDCREEARAVPSLAPIKIGVAINEKVTAAFEWEDATTLRPFVLFVSGDGSTVGITYRLRDGSYDADVNDSSSSAPFTSGVLFRHDGSTADNEMAYFTRGTAVGTTAAIYQRNKAGTGDDTGHTISPYGIYVVSSDLWIVSANGYEVQKWTLDTDPGLSGSYGTPIGVGRPTYPINYIANLGGSPLVVKGDGVFKYDPSPAVAQFISVLNFSSPHKDNGLATTSDGRGRVYIPSVEGHIIVITAGFQSSQTPVKDHQVDRDTPYGRITAMACDMDWVYAAVEPGQRYTSQLGLTVIADNSGSRTDETTDVTDGQFATVADITALTSGDYLYIGADEPFLGAYFTLATRRTTAGVSSTVVGYSSADNTFTAAANSHDSTTTFAQDGLITLQVAGNTDIYASGAWLKTTAYAGSATKYWMRLAFASVQTGCTISEVRLVPYRPPLDTTIFPETAYAIGGALPKILVGHWHGESIIWNDVWTIDGPRIEKMIVANGSCGALPSKRALYMATTEAIYAVPVGPDAHPIRAAWPKLADYSESTVAADTHALGFSAIDFEETVEFLEGLEFSLTGVQSDDTVTVYGKWDEDYSSGYMHLGMFRGQKNFRTNPPRGKGRILYTYMQYQDGSRSPMAPVLHSVTITPGSWRAVPREFAEEGDAQAPQLT